jgi:ribonucleoside-triphosphate reductase
MSMPSLSPLSFFFSTAPTATPFTLSSSFVESYRTKTTSFGFNGLGEVVYQRTYSRMMTDGTTPEQWFQTVARVVNGTYNMQKKWIDERQLGWDEGKAQVSAQRMYELMFDMKFLPPGRGLWAMGSPITEERSLYAALNNCAFVSTGDAQQEPSSPFCFLMDASMLGVGVGFDTLAAGLTAVHPPSSTGTTFTVPDSREGWVDSLRLLLDAYFVPGGGALPIFDYSDIRKAGTPIRGFGGVSSGSEVLVQLHQEINTVLAALVGSTLTVTAVVDIMNLIGKCVVSGNVRRSAEIAFGDPYSEEYIDLKNYEINPQREAYGWTSNNSIYAELGMDYEPSCTRIRKNGEPGFAWLENMRSYGRMNGVKVSGGGWGGG